MNFDLDELHRLVGPAEPDRQPASPGPAAGVDDVFDYDELSYRSLELRMQRCESDPEC